MELRHLRYFVAVADTLNFRRAAERVHIEQSPLSQQIRNLEKELGVELFTRTKRRVELTHAGTVFLKDAQAILARASDGVERARRASRGSVGTLTIAYLTSMTNEMFTEVVHKFQRSFPTVSLSFSDMLPSGILNAVQHHTADVGLVRLAFPSDTLAVDELRPEPFVVALPRNHRLTKKKKIAVADLKTEAFIMLPDELSMGYNDVIRTFCRDGGFSPEVHTEANQMQAVVWLVHLGLGLSLVPMSLQSLRRSNVVYRPLENPPTVTAKLVYRRDETSPIVKNFRELVRAVACG
jgi:DNA-binding transcriptional LysR family regulator